jgi:cytochrome c oxidase subunit 5a
MSSKWFFFCFFKLSLVNSVVAQRFYSSGHEEESYESFSERYVKFFDGVDDLFELQRGLNNCFAYDLVPSVAVIEAALKASRRVNDFPTSVRIFEGIEDKVENKKQYQEYLDELAPLRKELGIETKNELGF